MATIQTRVAKADDWDDVVAAFGRRGQDPDWCWCRRFFGGSENNTENSGGITNRAALRLEIESASIAPGLLAYVDDTPAGWSRVMPRKSVPGVGKNRALRRILSEDPGAWWVTCFAVHQQYRRTGVSGALLEAAVRHAGSHGATSIQGHPVDVDALRAEKVGGSALFTGTLRTFLAAGFEEIGRTYPSRPVMERNL